MWYMATWHRLGCPAAVQADNEWVFFGSPAHPWGMGKLIRLCLAEGIEPWFIPYREPGPNGGVEKFNDRYRSKFLPGSRSPALGPASHAFEQKQATTYSYSASVAAGTVPLRCRAAGRSG